MRLLNRSLTLMRKPRNDRRERSSIILSNNDIVYFFYFFQLFQVVVSPGVCGMRGRSG